MSDSSPLKPAAIANRLVRVREFFCNSHGLNRFPMDVDALAINAADILQWDDPIRQIVEVKLRNFDGALLRSNDKKSWSILYNPDITSSGRILFTKAHELGHYLLHRTKRDLFECGNDEINDFIIDGTNIENEANTFASTLLMPLDDYRSELNSTIDLDGFIHCAIRYGVSLTAAILRWIEYTEENAVLILSNDGFINWAYSSKRAARNGAFFKTKEHPPIEISDRSLCANASITISAKGENIKADIWFEHAHKDLSLKEFKMFSEQYDQTITLLLLPRSASVWKQREEDS